MKFFVKCKRKRQVSTAWLTSVSYELATVIAASKNMKRMLTDPEIT